MQKIYLYEVEQWKQLITLQDQTLWGTALKSALVNCIDSPAGEADRVLEHLMMCICSPSEHLALLQQR